MRLSRLPTLLVAVALCVGLTTARPVHGAEPATVKIGVLNISSDAPFIIADRKGYFRDEGITAVFTTFASSGNMIVPLSGGQLDVGGGAPTVGVYNGVSRGINIRVVADRGSDPPGYGFDPLMVRKDLVTSGKFKTPKDLKGMTVAGNQAGSVSASTLNELLKKYGLTSSASTSTTPTTSRPSPTRRSTRRSPPSPMRPPPRSSARPSASRAATRGTRDNSSPS